MSDMTSTGVAFDDVGTGEPALLLLPGWCCPRTVFAPLMPLLSAQRRVLALDWRGHGESASTDEDFGYPELVDDAASVIDASGASRVVPVAQSHAGWTAIDLRRELGPERVPMLVCLSWMVLGPPPPFLDALTGMQDLTTTRGVVEQTMQMWAGGVETVELAGFLNAMASAPDEMWARAAREIEKRLSQTPMPLEVLGALDPPPPTLHLYAQPPHDDLLAAQLAYAADNPWFAVQRLDAKSHFPMFEEPQEIADRIEEALNAS